MGPGFRRGRRRGLIMGAAIGSAAARRNQSSQPQTENTNDQISELEKLAELKDKGVITQEEFDAKKQQILGL